MIIAKNKDVETVAVNAIEGEPVYGGPLFVKPLMKGDEMLLMEIHYSPGVGAPVHVHNHESVTYVVRGKVKMIVGEETYELMAGDVCRHPAGVPHCVEAIEESVMIEIKSPTPDIKHFFSTN